MVTVFVKPWTLYNRYPQGMAGPLFQIYQRDARWPQTLRSFRNEVECAKTNKYPKPDPNPKIRVHILGFRLDNPNPEINLTEGQATDIDWTLHTDLWKSEKFQIFPYM